MHTIFAVPPPQIKLKMIKIGILGGGQLGRMLLQSAANYPVITHVLDPDSRCPSAHLCHEFHQGDFKNFETVYRFGKQLDAITIEIESVNVEALEKLQSEGKKIYPTPQTIRIIRNKILQKEFYKNNNIPSSDFVITQLYSEIHQHLYLLPAVHKIAQGGYDGRGVQMIHSAEDIEKGFNEPAVLEKKISIAKEIAIIIAKSNSNETVIYPPVEMVFDPVLNLLSHQICPAEIGEEVLWKAEAIALRVVNHFKSAGIFAVEMLCDADGNVFVNETAPRVHNSGHHTIEACFSSQFDMLWRIILDFPLGNPAPILPAALVNIVGPNGNVGIPDYKNLNKILAMDNVFVHIYGKEETRPGRKMGHVTILSKEKQELIHRAVRIKHLLSAEN